VPTCASECSRHRRKSASVSSKRQCRLLGVAFSFFIPSHNASPAPSAGELLWWGSRSRSAVAAAPPVPAAAAIIIAVSVGRAVAIPVV
jgi:hypothetical protein